MLNELLELHDKGIKYLMAEYSGGGDSGSIETWDYYTSAQVLGDDEFDIVDQREVAPHHLTDDDIPKVIVDYVYKLLNDIEDWYNNDGGYGLVVIDTKTCNYKIFNHVHYRETIDYNHEGKIDF
jgi:hypothetical protein